MERYDLLCWSVDAGLLDRLNIPCYTASGGLKPSVVADNAAPNQERAVPEGAQEFERRKVRENTHELPKLMVSAKKSRARRHRTKSSRHDSSDSDASSSDDSSNESSSDSSSEDGSPRPSPYPRRSYKRSSYPSSSDDTSSDSDSSHPVRLKRSIEKHKRSHGGSHKKKVNRHRSKIPGFPKLSDGINPSPDAWRANIRHRIKHYWECFETEDEKIAFVWENTEGAAQEHLPRINVKPKYGGWKSSKEMIRALLQRFNVATRRETARRKFRRLKQKDSTPFVEFKQAFLTLAIEARIQESEWRNEMKEKINARLLDAIAAVEDSRKFRKFHTFCVEKNFKVSVRQRSCSTSRSF